MTTEVTASLGFSVDTGALDRGKQSLDQFADSTKKVKQSAEELNSAGQTAGAATESLGNKATATGKSFSLFGNAINEVKSFLGFHTAGATSAAGASEALGTSIGHANTATRGFRDSLHVLNPLVYSLGGNLSGMGTFAGAARAGIIGLAGAITLSLIASLEKAADKLDMVKRELGLFLGGSGQQAFDGLAKSTDAARVPLDAYQKGLVSVHQALGNLSSFVTIAKDPITGEWVTQAGIYSNELDKIAGQLTTIGTRTGQAPTASARVLDKFLQDLGQAKQLTSDVFDALRKAGPAGEAMAQAISGAFGQGGPRGADQFLQQLQRMPKSIDDVVSHLKLFLEQSRQVAEVAAIPPNVTQSWDHFTTSVSKLWSALGKSGGPITSFFDSISNAIDGWRAKIEQGHGLLATIFSPPQGWANAFNQAVDIITNKLHHMWDDIDPLTQQILSSIASAATSIVNSVASAIESIVSKVLAAIAAMNAAAPLGLPASSGGVDSNGNPISSAGPSFTVPMVGGGFATGGDFTVKNSQRVMFHASPDEIVTVEPPGKKAAVFLVGGSGGTDSQRVQFPAVAGTHVTITPPGQSLPNTVFGTSGILADGSVTSAGVKQATSAAISSISGINTGASSGSSGAGQYGTVRGQTFTGAPGYGGSFGSPMNVSNYAASGGIYSAYNPLGAPIFSPGLKVMNDPTGWGFGGPTTGGTWNTVWNSGGGSGTGSGPAPPPVVTVDGAASKSVNGGPSWFGSGGNGSTWKLSNDPNSPDYYGSLANDYGYFAQGGAFTVGSSAGQQAGRESQAGMHIGGDHIEFQLKMPAMGGGRRPSFVASRSQIRRSMVGRI